MSQQADQNDWLELVTLGDLLVRGARFWPNSDAVVLDDTRYTYKELLQACETMAGALLASGVQPGDRVGIFMPTCMDFVRTLFACTLVGVTPVLINARFRAQEISYVLQDSEVVTVITSDVAAEYIDGAGRIREALDGHTMRFPPVLLGGTVENGFIHEEEYLAASAAVSAVHRARNQVRLRQPGIMLYTSGTTGKPKGCPLTHEALVRVAEMTARTWKLGDTDRVWDPLPLFHIGGMFPLLACLLRGSTFVSLVHFEPGLSLRQMEQERCTLSYPLFPTLMQALIHHPDFQTADLSSIRVVVHAAPLETMRKVQGHWPHARVTSVYGSTECAGVVSLGSADDPEEKRLGAVGRPLPGVSVRIVDPETGTDLPAGQSGEIVVHSPSLFDAYHNDPVKTAAEMSEGWFKTGDRGKLDEAGFLVFQGRIKDMLKVGGENVAASELETYLETHPAVKLAQIVGVPDTKYVEVPAAFVELLPGASVDGDALLEFCQGKIAGFKVPRYFRVVQAWPTSATKIQKFKLRQGLIDELGLHEES